MADDPFAPPKTSVADSDGPPQPGSLWKGVLIGGVVDLGGTTILGIVIFFTYAVLHVTPEMSQGDLEVLSEQFTRDAARLDSVWGLAGIGLGSGLSLLGGYVCARFAKESWKLATLILGVAVAAIGVASAAEYYLLGENLSLGLLTVAIVYFGGWLREGRRPRTP